MSMNARNVVLERPMMYDNNGIHRLRENMYTIIKDGKVITLYLMKPEPPKKGSR